MIQVRLLTNEQKDLLMKKTYDEIQFFNPVQDKYNNWIISEEEVNQTINQDFLWVKELPIIEFVSKEII